jgi:hypothetical protein
MASSLSFFRRNQAAMIIGLLVFCMIGFLVFPVLQMYWEGTAREQSNGTIASFSGTKITTSQLLNDGQTHVSTISYLNRIANEVIQRGGVPRVPGFRQGNNMQVSLGVPMQLNEQGLVAVRFWSDQARQQGLEIAPEATDQWMIQFCDQKLTPDELRTFFKQSFGEANLSNRTVSFKQWLSTLLSYQLMSSMFSVGINDATDRSLVPLQQTWDDFCKLTRSGRATVYPFLVDDYLEQAPKDFTESEIRARYDEGKERFPNPTTREAGFRKLYAAEFETVSFSRDQIRDEEKAKISEDAVRKLYDEKVAAGFLKVPVQAPPATETPAAETPAADAPASDAPASDAPASDAPASDAPASDAPASDAPASDAPASDAPASDAPASDAPASDAPASDAPASDAPASDAPASDAPASDAPASDAPATGIPAVEPPATPPVDPGAVSPAAGNESSGGAAAGADGAPAAGTQGNLDSARSPLRLVAARAQESTQETPPAEASATSAATPAPPAPPAVTDPAPPASTDAAATASPPAGSETSSSSPPEATVSPSETTPPASGDAATAAPVDGTSSPGVTTPPTGGEVAPMRTLTFDEARDQLLDELAQQPSAARLDAAVDSVRKAMRNYEMELNRARQQKELGQDVEEPAMPDLFRLSKDLGGEHSVTGLVDAIQFTGKVADSFVQFQGNGGISKFSNFGLSNSVRLYDPVGSISISTFETLITWKIRERDAYMPSIDEVREEVIKSLQYDAARTLAQQAANELASKANQQVDRPLSELVPETRTSLVKNDIGPTTWMTLRNRGASGPQPVTGSLPEVDLAGDEFMRAMFTGESGKWQVAANEPASVYYVLRGSGFEPSEDQLRKQFLEVARRMNAEFVSRQASSLQIQSAEDSIRKESGFEVAESFIAN